MGKGEEGSLAQMHCRTEIVIIQIEIRINQSTQLCSSRVSSNLQFPASSTGTAMQPWHTLSDEDALVFAI